MVGMFRLVVAGQTRVVQLMTLVEEEPGVILSLNHFTPQLQRWEREEEPPSVSSHRANRGQSRLQLPEATGEPARTDDLSEGGARRARH